MHFYDVCASTLLADYIHCYGRQLSLLAAKGQYDGPSWHFDVIDGLMILFPNEQWTKCLHCFHRQEPSYKTNVIVYIYTNKHREHIIAIGYCILLLLRRLSRISLLVIAFKVVLLTFQ